MENLDGLSDYAIFEGTFLAVTIALFGLVLSTVIHRFFAARRTPWGRAAETYVCTGARLLFSSVCLIVVFIVFGPSWGVPCVLVMIPLYFLEIVLGVWIHLRHLN